MDGRCQELSFGQGFSSVLPDDVHDGKEVQPKQDQGGGIRLEGRKHPIGPVEHGMAQHGGKDASIRVGIQPGEYDTSQSCCQQETPQWAIVVIF